MPTTQIRHHSRQVPEGEDLLTGPHQLKKSSPASFALPASSGPSSEYSTTETPPPWMAKTPTFSSACAFATTLAPASTMKQLSGDNMVIPDCFASPNLPTIYILGVKCGPYGVHYVRLTNAWLLAFDEPLTTGDRKSHRPSIFDRAWHAAAMWQQLQVRGITPCLKTDARSQKEERNPWGHSGATSSAGHRQRCAGVEQRTWMRSSGCGCGGAPPTALSAGQPAVADEQRIAGGHQRVVHAHAVHRLHPALRHVPQQPLPARHPLQG